MALPPANASQPGAFQMAFAPSAQGQGQPLVFPGAPQAQTTQMKPGFGYVPFQPVPPTESLNQRDVDPRQPPVESSEQANEGMLGTISGFISRGIKRFTEDGVPDSSHLPKRSVMEQIELCSGLSGDYKIWKCPECTLENSVEFTQCEVCEKENLVLKAILEAIGRPGKKRGDGKLKKLWGWISK